MYITREEYITLYGDIGEQEFNFLSFDASRIMDIHTTGIDNVAKLRMYPPVNEYDEKAVKYCEAKLIHFLHQIQTAEIAGGYETTEHGVRGKVITSVSSGNESITYSTGTATAIDAAVKDKKVRDSMAADIVWDSLRGISDANGVGLLYMAKYPRM